MKSLSVPIGRPTNENNNQNSLLSFSRILATKHNGNRIAPIYIPPAFQRPKSAVARVSKSASGDLKMTDLHNTSTKSAVFVRNPSIKSSKSQSMAIDNIDKSFQSESKTRTSCGSTKSFKLLKHHSNKNLKNISKKKRLLIKRILLAICICATVSIVLITALTLTLIKPSTTTTTTTTRTTATTTTLTSTTSTTSTTTTTTSTSTTSTATTTTTETTTSVTTETTETTTTDTTTTTSCYFGGDYASLVDGGQRQISNLKAGDRVWSLSSDGKQLVEDEIMCIAHTAPNTLTNFYTFTTSQGQVVSLTDRHFLVVVHSNEKQIKTIPASKVTLEHQLFIVDQIVNISNIVIIQRIGYYSPITLSGYLLVNNISTSVYSDMLEATHEFFHQIAGVARVYYHVTRWLFGKDYYPFAAQLEEEELHPVSQFIIAHYTYIEFLFVIFPWIIPTLLLIYVIHRIYAMKKYLKYFSILN